MDYQRLTDDELIVRCLSGDKLALNELVWRYRETVFAFAYSVTRNHEDAEDLTQEIFLEALRSLHALCSPAKFHAWLYTIAHRVAARWVKCKSAERAIIASAPFDHLPDDVAIIEMPVTEEPLPQESRAALRQAIHSLAMRYREVLTLHYLDGLSCEEISHRLQVPIGTIKRWLHEARATLRKEMMPMQAKQKMLTEKFRVVIWGVYSGKTDHPFILCRSLLVQRILVSIAKQAKTPEAIASEVKTDVVYVHDELDRLERNELAVKDGKGRYRANCFVLLHDDRAAIDAFAQKIGEKAVDIIANELPKIKEVIANCSFERQGFGWEQMQWVIVPVFLANMGVRRCYPEIFNITPPLRLGGDHWYAFLEESPEHPKWIAGCNMSTTEVGGTAHFWTPQVKKRSNDPLNPNQYLPIIKALVNRPLTTAELAKATSLKRQELAERLSYLLELGYVQKQGQKLRLNFPVFLPDDLKKVEAVTKSVCQRIVDEAYKPNFVGIERLFDRLGYRHLKEQYPALKGYIGSDAINFTVRALVEKGVLPQPPSKAPSTFGFFAWLGRSDLFSVQ